MKRLAILVMAAVALTATAAFSQVAAPQPPSQTTALLDSIRPALTDLSNAAITLLAGALIWFVKKKWGIDLSSFRQSTFQIAASNAAGIYKSTGDMPRAVEYLKGAAPDAIEHFALSDASLPEKIKAKAGILDATTTVVPVVQAPSGLSIGMARNDRDLRG